MSKEDEILEQLREIREAQTEHHRQWQARMREANEYQKAAMREVARTKRRVWVPIIVVVALILGIEYLSMITSLWQVPEMYDDIADAVSRKPIATPEFDGKYVVDAARSFGQTDRADPKATMLVGMLAEQFDGFTIDHGVIRSGRGLRQEFRIVSGEVDGDTLVGRALWHEDVHDPGDCCIVEVRLRFTGDVLEFWYYEEGGGQGDPVVLNRQ